MSSSWKRRMLPEKEMDKAIMSTLCRKERSKWISKRFGKHGKWWGYVDTDMFLWVVGNLSKIWTQQIRSSFKIRSSLVQKFFSRNGSYWYVIRSIMFFWVVDWWSIFQNKWYSEVLYLSFIHLQISHVSSVLHTFSEIRKRLSIVLHTN